MVLKVALLLCFSLFLAACGTRGEDPAIKSPTPATTQSTAVSPSLSPAPSAPSLVAAFLPGLNSETVAILDACLAGDNAACDRAQEPGRLNDSNFSRLNQACTQAKEGACKLKDRLVAAELRLHCKEGDQAACNAVKNS